jgi:hypothetical protein
LEGAQKRGSLSAFPCLYFTGVTSVLNRAIRSVIRFAWASLISYPLSIFPDVSSLLLQHHPYRLLTTSASLLTLSCRPLPLVNHAHRYSSNSTQVREVTAHTTDALPHDILIIHGYINSPHSTKLQVLPYTHPTRG